MKDSSVNALAALMARSPEWDCLSNNKTFDEKQTSILRVYQHTGTGAYAAFAQHSPVEDTERVGIEVNSKRARAIADVAKACYLPAALVAKA